MRWSSSLALHVHLTLHFSTVKKALEAASYAHAMSGLLHPRMHPFCDCRCKTMPFKSPPIMSYLPLLSLFVLTFSTMSCQPTCEYANIEYDKLLALQSNEFSFLMIKKACVDQEVSRAADPLGGLLCCTCAHGSPDTDCLPLFRPSSSSTQRWVTGN